MQKTKIEWCDYSWNPIKGYCPNSCPYCYAHRMYNRFGWDKTLRFNFSELYSLDKIKKPSRIFVSSTIDMYHESIYEPWARTIIVLSRDHPEHTFITLTKFPEFLSKYNFPENWWVGTTIDGKFGTINDVCLRALDNDKNKKFISFEPILTSLVTHYSLEGMDWIIIGGLTPVPIHKKEWIDDIVKRADDLNIPVFIKDNAHYPVERKEFPI